MFYSAHLLYLLQRQRCWYVLLVGQDQQCGAKQALLLQQCMQLLPASSNAATVE
jgi:hypothetical protein